jgi:hypothetical protein
MKFAIIAACLLLCSCRGCMPGAGYYTEAAELDTSTVARVEIWVRHDLGYEADTVEAVVWYRSGNQWYVKLINGERWSDREPKILEE